jgi:hypothetical protein
MDPTDVKLDELIDNQKNEKHFIDLFGSQDVQRASAFDLFSQFRNLVISGLKKKGDVIIWQGGAILAEDEQLSPTFEELILVVVLSLIDIQLPGHVKNEYDDLLGKEKSLMDFKADILVKVPTFLSTIESHRPVISKNNGDLLARYVSHSV